MLQSFFIYCGDTDAWKAGKYIFRQISTTLCTLAVLSAQPLIWSRRLSWKLNFAIKSFERSRQCFLPQPLFDSTNNCFISPRPPQIHALTQIWSSSSCLVSFHPIQRFRTTPPHPHPASVSALSSTVYRHYNVALSSSNLITNHVSCQTLSKIMMITFGQLMRSVLSSIYILLNIFFSAFVPTVVNICSKIAVIHL